MKKKLITILVPCYNEEENVIHTYNLLKKITQKISSCRFEFIFVDNGSNDRTKYLIKKLAGKDKSLIGIFLSRNFGPEGSGQAGYDAAHGDALIGLAADLQDPPDMIPKFIRMWQKGFDAVIGIYKNKSDDNFVIFNLRKAFYFIFHKIASIDVPVNSTGYGIYGSKILNALKLLPEKYRFTRGLTAWVGFNKTYLFYEKRKRTRGISKYNFYQYMKVAERGLFGFSYLPLDIMIYFGILLVLLSFIFILFYIIYVSIFGNPIKGSVTLLVSILFFGGIQLLSTSIIGKYIQVIMEETKRRPVYIIDETVNYKRKP